MPAPHISTNYGDLLDPRFQKIFYEQYDQLPSMIDKLFSTTPHNNRADMRWSSIGAFGDWSEFTGTVAYDSLNQGYDTTATYMEFVSGAQIERKLFDDDQYNIMDKRPQGLAISAKRTREKHGARVLNNMGSVDSYFYTNSEGVALVSDSHTTTAAGVSTSVGFDNKVTSALTATALSAARIQGQKFRDDRGNRIQNNFDELWVPLDLYDQAFEIVRSSGKPDTANNNKNVHEDKYKIETWNYLTDANDWSLQDSTMRKMALHWVDRVPMEFKMAEDIDTLVAKWRGYMRYALAHTDWRWLVGAVVS